MTSYRRNKIPTHERNPLGSEPVLGKWQAESENRPTSAHHVSTEKRSNCATQWTPKRLERYLQAEFWILCGGWHAARSSTVLLNDKVLSTTLACFCHTWLPPAAMSLASPNHTAGLMEVSFQSLWSSLVFGDCRLIYKPLRHRGRDWSRVFKTKVIRNCTIL